MLHIAYLAILWAAIMAVTLVLSPGPDAIQLMIWQASYFAVAALGYWLGWRSGQASRPRG